MIKINKHIEIVRTSVIRLSSMSQASADAILAVLSKHYTSVEITIINDLADLEALEARQPDLVFLGMEFIPTNATLGPADPNKVWLGDYLDEHDIAYTGSGREAHELEHNKSLAKQRALDAGLMTSPFWVVHQSRPLTEQDVPLKFPLFIKPTDLGGGLGVDTASVARNFGELKSKVLSIADKLGSDSLIEEYLPGREFSVAILRSQSSADFLVMPIELIAPADVRGDRILSGLVKSSNTELAVEITDKYLKSRVVKLALDVFKALGARDFGRIDIRLDKNGTPNFLEANLIPSLISGYGSFPKACEINEGLDYESMILSITRLALNRTKNLVEEIPEPAAALETLPVFGLA